MTDTISSPEDIEDVADALGEGRPLRNAAAYRIKMAIDSTMFTPLFVTDPVPLGRQVLAAGGIDAIEDHSLFAIVANGDFEDVRLDEPVDLRVRGVERFIAFSTDPLYRFKIDTSHIVWGLPSVSEEVLRDLADIGGDKGIYLEVRGGTDRLINPGEEVDLTQSGVERFITAARQRQYIFFVNGVRYQTDQEALTGLQVKARVADWDTNHDLVLEGHGDDPDRIIGDDEVVHLDIEHGRRRFSSVPKATFG